MSTIERLAELAATIDSGLPAAITEAAARVDELDDRLAEATTADEYHEVAELLDAAVQVQEDLEARHAARLNLGDVLLRTDTCTAHRGRVTRRSGAQARVLRRHSHRPARSLRPSGRRRGAGRPAARRTSSSSRTASTDPGDPDPAPPARRARYTFAVLTAEQRGEGWSR